MNVARRLVRELRGRRARRAPGPRERKLVSLLPAAWRRFIAAPRFWR